MNMTTQQTLFFSCPFFWHKLRRVAAPKIIPSKVPNGATILSHITYLSTNVPHRGTDPLRWIRQPFCQHLLQVNAHCALIKKSHTTKISLNNSLLGLINMFFQLDQSTQPLTWPNKCQDWKGPSLFITQLISAQHRNNRATHCSWLKLRWHLLSLQTTKATQHSQLEWKRADLSSKSRNKQFTKVRSD